MRGGVAVRAAQGFDDIVEFKAEFLSVFKKLATSWSKELKALASFGKSGIADDHPNAGPAGKVAGALQLGDDLVGGGGTDLEVLTDGAHGGEGVARGQLTSQDCFADGPDDLVGDRDAVLKVEREGEHVAIRKEGWVRSVS